MDNRNTYEKRQNNKLTGVIYGVSAYTLWGLLPLYWKLLTPVPADQILAHRIVWSFVFVAALLLFSGGLSHLLGIVKDKKKLLFISFCSVLITVNWFTYIWAVNSSHIVETSLGYYINPLMAVFLGMTVLKERLGIFQYIAFALAAAGVIILAVQYGKIPWISLVLATTFALYGLFKKLVAAESAAGLALETAVVTPLAVAYLAFKQVTGTAALGSVPPVTAVLLLCTGVATAVPLLWFAKGTKRTELSTMGFLQYISPTISLIIGVLIYKEQFTRTHLISFGFIWAALVVFSFSQVSAARNIQPVSLKNN
ncbi:MAG: EamA family transporter RarD [Clostridiales bacterium]|jgi:chloramphenicol-sensitive protein RarD|nr:EamA family transporter RarD [Eubacteriales bacterium]MDH7566751.1 EamA family transporter RarD [Clostridiales bacterium]